jgi:hypothetical protein
LSTEKSSREIEEYEALMQRRFEKYRKVLFVLKDVLQGFEFEDSKSIRGIETYLRLIELSEQELAEQERQYKDWFKSNITARSRVNDGVKARLEEYKRKLGAETDEEIIEELLNMVEGGFSKLPKRRRRTAKA